MMPKKGYTKFVNFMNHRARILVLGCGHIRYIVKCIISLKIFFSSLRHRSDKLLDYQGRVYQNCKILFNYPRGRGSCAGAWSYSEHAIYLHPFLSTLGHGSDKLSNKQ